jgi:hypothetical protein
MPIRTLTPSFTRVEKSDIFLLFFTAVPVFKFLSFASLVSVIGVIIFNTTNRTLKFSGKSIPVDSSLALLLIELDTDPDRQALDGYGSGSGKIMPIRPDPDPQHNRTCQEESICRRAADAGAPLPEDPARRSLH